MLSVFRSLWLWLGARVGSETKAAQKSDYFHGGAAGGARARLRADTLPGHLHTRGTGPADQTDRGQSTGDVILSSNYFNTNLWQSNNQPASQPARQLDYLVDRQNKRRIEVKQSVIAFHLLSKSTESIMADLSKAIVVHALTQKKYLSANQPAESCTLTATLISRFTRIASYCQYFCPVLALVFDVCFASQVWFSNRRARWRKQVGSTQLSAINTFLQLPQNTSTAPAPAPAQYMFPESGYHLPSAPGKMK